MQSVIVPGAGTIASTLAEEDLRRLCAEVALSVQHLDFSVNPTDYAAFLFPYDDPKWALEAAATMYSCALGGRGLLLRMGCRDAHLTVPYQRHVGFAVSDVLASCGAWVDARKPNTPLPGVGDLIYIDNAARTNPHVEILAGWNEDETALFAPNPKSVATTVNGGETLKDDQGRPKAGPGFRFEPHAVWFDRISDVCLMVRSAITPTGQARQLVGYGPITKYRLTAPVGIAGSEENA